MKYFMLAAFMIACGDKETDTATEDSSTEEEE